MASTTSGLSNTMSIFYDKVFLERAEEVQVYKKVCDVKPLPTNSGKSVYWNRFSPLAKQTTALTEATNPSEVSMTSTQVTATVADYGAYTTVSSLYNLTSIDVDLKEHVQVHGQNAGETLDELIANEMSANGTTQLAIGNTLLTDIGTTDVMTGLEVRRAVKTLKKNKAWMFPGNLFRGIISATAAYDLRGNSEWLDASRYTDPTNLKMGLLGKLHGVEFYETNNEVSESSTTTVYSNFICGQHGVGMVDIASGSAPKIYVKTPNEYDTSNPLNLYSRVGWRMTTAARVLNADWVINVKVGSA